MQCEEDAKSQRSSSSQSGDSCTNGMSNLKVNVAENTVQSEVSLKKESMTTMESTQHNCNGASNQEDKPSSQPVSGNCTNNSQAICDYCTLTFESDSALHVHCQTEAHQIVVMSDGGGDWK